MPDEVVSQGLSRLLPDSTADVAIWLDAREPVRGGDLEVYAKPSISPVSLQVSGSARGSCITLLIRKKSFVQVHAVPPGQVRVTAGPRNAGVGLSESNGSACRAGSTSCGSPG